MADDDMALAVLIAVGVSAADIVEDPLPLSLSVGDVPDRDLRNPQLSLAELIFDAENEMTFLAADVETAHPSGNLTTSTAKLAAALPPNSDNYATALVDSPFDPEWLFTTTASQT